MPRQEVAALTGCTAVLAIALFLMRAAFPDHPDYLGHFAAGAGATMLLLVVVRAFAADPDDVLTVALLMTAVAIGALAEASVFRLAAFDRMDFALQSAGAALAAILFMVTGTAARSLAAFFLGFGFLVLGFVIVAGATGAA